MLVSAFWTPTIWRWLIDTCGFTPDEAGQAAGWAIDALVTALKTDASGLADAAAKGPRKRERKK